jgi:hypothetical protein
MATTGIRGRRAVALGVPPGKIMTKSLTRSTSSITNSVASDYVYKELRVHGDPSPCVQPAKVKVRSHVNNKIAKQKRDFRRSPHLEAAMERIEKRRMKEPVYRQEKAVEPEEIDQLLHLFHKYEDVLEHLVKKNQRLHSFVDGEAQEYPSHFSYTTVQILDTLKKLKIQREQSLAKTDNNKPSKSRSQTSDPRLRKDHEYTPISSVEVRKSLSSRSSSVPKDQKISNVLPTSTFRDRRKESADKLAAAAGRLTRRSKLGLGPVVEINNSFDSDAPITQYPDRQFTDAPRSEYPQHSQSLLQSRNDEDPPINMRPNHEDLEDDDSLCSDSPSSSQSRSNSNEKRWGRYGEPSVASDRITLPRFDEMSQSRASDRRGTGRASTPMQTPDELFDLLHPRKNAIQAAPALSPNLIPRSRSESRDEIRSSPPPSGFETRNSTSIEKRMSPPRFVTPARTRVNVYNTAEDSGHAKSEDAAISVETPTGTCREHFLAVSPLRNRDLGTPTISRHADMQANSYSTTSPSYKSRQLSSHIDEVSKHSQGVKASQNKLRGDLIKTKEKYHQRSKELQNAVYQAMPAESRMDYINGVKPVLPHFPESRSQQPHPKSRPVVCSVDSDLTGPLQSASFSFIELENGVIHVEEDEDVSPGAQKSSTLSNHMEDDVIRFEYESDAIRSIIHLEEDDSINSDPLGIYDADDDLPTSHKSSLHVRDTAIRKEQKKKSKKAAKKAGIQKSLDPVTIVTNVKKLSENRSKMRENPHSLVSSSDSISTHLSQVGFDQNQNRVEVEIGISEDGVQDMLQAVVADKHRINDILLNPRKKQVRWQLQDMLQDSALWKDHCGTLPSCGMASF